MYPKATCGCGKEMTIALYPNDRYPDSSPTFWLCPTCGNKVNIGPVDGEGKTVPPKTYAPEFIDQMSETEAKELSKDLSSWALNIFSLVSHWYMTHYEDETQFPDEERATARFDLLRAVGVEDQFMNLPPVEWVKVEKEGDKS